MTALSTLCTSSRIAPRTIFRCSATYEVARYARSNTTTARRLLSTSSEPSLRRSYLYVPASSDRMLQKSLNLGVPPDVVIYDLEDSVSPTLHEKKAARQRLTHFLHVRGPTWRRGGSADLKGDSRRLQGTSLPPNASRYDSMIRVLPFSRTT